MRVFEMDAGGGRLPIIVVALMLLVVILVVAITIGTTRTPRFEVSKEGLRIRGNLYGRMIPMAHLRLDAARVVEIASSTDLQPVRRTNGASIGATRAGWFRLRNGEKALVFLTRNPRAAYIPTTQGYSVLLGVNEPDALLSSLRSPEN
jgi:hypothetical protein